MLVPDTSLIQLLGGSIFGLFGGFGATAIWEGFVKPARERRNLARSLATEILANRHRLIRAVEARERGTLPFNLRLSSIVFESVAEKLAELPEEILPEIVRIYHRFASVNAVKAHAQDIRSELDVAGPNATAAVRARFASVLQGLDENVTETLTEVNELLPKLVRCGGFTSEPWLQFFNEPQSHILPANTGSSG